MDIDEFRKTMGVISKLPYAKADFHDPSKRELETKYKMTIENGKPKIKRHI